jgi:predicted DCC family thiol-disulfide oxidoreductase YuxK
MEISDLPNNKKIILFDGVCNLCNQSILFVIKHDKKDIFRFVSLQSELGLKIVKHIGIANQNIDSVILYEPGKAYYYRSDAAMQIAKSLGGIFHFGTIFRILPTRLRNLFYDFVAINRYKWFGKQETCNLPSKGLEAKFLV